MPPNLQIQTFADAQAFLFSRFDLERTMNTSSPDTFKLDRMRQLAELLGNPQKKIKTIHIAGTKGKGSVSSMVSQILTNAGYTTGLFTSPHLEHLGQRFCINGVPCCEESLIELIQQLVPAVEEMDRRDTQQTEVDLRPTFFEITTALAFLYFYRAGADIAVVEVGLGGRLDSTNICEPVVTAITNIGLDHTEILGDTLELIAREKAGIIKPGIPLINGCTLDGPRQVIERIALERQAPLVSLSTDIQFSLENDSQIFPLLKSISIQETCYWEDLTIGIPGQHQLANAAVCLGIIHELGKQDFPIADQAIKTGLAEVQCAGRLELIDSRPQVLLDVAHNPNSVDALAQFLTQHFPDTKLHLILSCSKDKQYEEMTRLLIPLFHSITFTKFTRNPRAVEPHVLYQSAVTACNNLASRTQTESNPLTAFQQILERANENDLVVVTGSFYLIAELRQQALMLGN
tara:strand:- start:2864 stop:4246 length:1383 start_codon:yes stop_codon:yes gene_type:complete